MYDLIIVGAGPGGMTAAIYAARRKIKFLVISLDVGGQMSWSPEVENYPGFEHISGFELTKEFIDHTKKYKVKVKQEEVLKIEKKEKKCYITTKKRIYESKAVIIISGKKPKKLNVPGEEKFLGKGLTYCVTCDAPLYKKKRVIVVGGGNSGLEAALYLSVYAKKVYIVESSKKLFGDSYLINRILKNKKIKLVTNSKIKEIVGDKNVKGIKYDHLGKEKMLKAKGIFVEIGLITQADFIDCKKNENGEIMISRSTKNNEENLTSIPGVFAAGDVTDIPAKQIVVAAGEGAKAVLASLEYVAKWDKKNKK